MILTRTPFRIPLGGGGTDLLGFYKKHGGFIFSATIDKYMYVTVNRPFLDKLIYLKYTKSETVDSIHDLQHDLAREALKAAGIVKNIEITSFADLSGGTGMGSSGSYLVGLLKALYSLNRKEISTVELAELACKIEIEILKKPVGKQDQYLASIGGFVEMHIDQGGKVTVYQPQFTYDTISELRYKTMLFYTNKKHNTIDILKDQDRLAAVSESAVEKALLQIKEIGQQIKTEFEKENISNFGKLMDEHWRIKKTMSNKISDPKIDQLYEIAKKNGAEGGKIMGSGGGGLFLFFVPEHRTKLKQVMELEGLSELPYDFDFEGSKVLLNAL